MSLPPSLTRHNRIVIKIDLLGGRVRSRIFVGSVLLGAQVGASPAAVTGGIGGIGVGGVGGSGGGTGVGGPGGIGGPVGVGRRGSVGGPSGVGGPGCVIGELPLSAPISVLAPKIRRLSEAVTAALFAREKKEMLDRLVHVKGSRSGVEVVVEAEPAVSSLPFELLRVRPSQFLVDSPHVGFYRRAGSAGSAGVAGAASRSATAPRPGRLSILVLQPVDDSLVDETALAAIYADAVATGDADVTTVALGHERSFAEALRSRPFHVAHVFGGSHALDRSGLGPGPGTGTDTGTGTGGTSPGAGSATGDSATGDEDRDGEGIAVRAGSGVRMMPAERLAALLADAVAPVPLVVVSGGRRRPDGLAQELVRHGVDRVLATQDALAGSHASSSMFTVRAFYAALATDPGLSVAGALAQARQAFVARHPDGENDHHGAPIVRSYWTTVHTLFAVADDPPLRADAPQRGVADI